jgi:hypothetical protein
MIGIQAAFLFAIAFGITAGLVRGFGGTEHIAYGTFAGSFMTILWLSRIVGKMPVWSVDSPKEARTKKAEKPPKGSGSYTIKVVKYGQGTYGSVVDRYETISGPWESREKAEASLAEALRGPMAGESPWIYDCHGDRLEL